MSQALLKRLVQKFSDEVIDTHQDHGDDTVVIKRDRVTEICQWLKDDPANAIDFMRDVTAVDYLLMERTPRFEVVYHLYSLTKKHSLRLKIPLEEDDLVMDSLSLIWPSANWAEREVWDMYGIRFANHPDLRRVLLYEEFEGHPLRKDYDKRKSQPRLNLLSPERDSVAEYESWESKRKGPKEVSS